MRLLLIALLLLAHASPCRAHAVGISRGEYRSEGDGVHVDVIFARPEMMTALPGLDADGDAVLSDGEIAAARSRLSDWLIRGVRIDSPAGTCAGSLASATTTEQDGLELKALYRCPDRGGGFAVRLDLLSDLSLGHRHLATASAGDATVRAALYSAEPRLEVIAGGASPLAASSSSGERVRGMDDEPLFRLGIERLLFGYDHLLFVVALLLVGGRLRAVATWIVAFTLAHSIALALGALGVFAPRNALVGPATGLTLAYVGVENCLGSRFDRRWRIVFLCGLVHGFGFADALRQAAVSARELPLALASFNGGVETAQAAVLAVVLPLFSRLGTREWFARGVRLASAAISLLGLWWFAARIGGI